NALKPNQPEILGAYAQANYFAQGQRLDAKAIAFLKQALVLQPQQIDAMNLLALDAYGKKDYAVAIQFWEQLLPLFPPNTENGRWLLQMIHKAQRQVKT